MPCYNAEDTVDKAVQSILQQSLERLELILVDDGSRDGTAAKLAEWASSDRRVRVIARSHEGILGALNAGLSHCQAPYVARMDADDIARPERLARQVETLDAHPDLAVVGSLVEGFPQEDVREGFRIYLDWLNRLVTHDAIVREIFIESPLAHPSVCMRRRWLERVGGYQDHGWPEDYDLWLRLYLAGARFAKVPEVLLYWREHPQRLTRQDSRYAVEQFLRAKAHYLARGPLSGGAGVILWGAGQMGRRLSKHLLQEGVPILAFVDVDEKKIGRTRRGKMIHPPESLRELLQAHPGAKVLAAVRSRGARALIRERLLNLGLREGRDWWAVA